MITVYWNNKDPETTITLEKNSNLSHALEKRAFEYKHCAIMLNQNFIPRAHHATTILKDGDVISIVEPMQGG